MSDITLRLCDEIIAHLERAHSPLEYCDWLCDEIEARAEARTIARIAKEG